MQCFATSAMRGASELITMHSITHQPALFNWYLLAGSRNANFVQEKDI
jgi:hypothetical protein